MRPEGDGDLVWEIVYYAEIHLKQLPEGRLVVYYIRSSTLRHGNLQNLPKNLHRPKPARYVKSSKTRIPDESELRLKTGLKDSELTLTLQVPTIEGNY